MQRSLSSSFLEVTYQTARAASDAAGAFERWNSVCVVFQFLDSQQSSSKNDTFGKNEVQQTGDNMMLAE